jgi:hypothetical protein
VVDAEDIESALAFWSVCETSARSVFGTKTGDRMADRLLREMPRSTDFSYTELRGFFGTGSLSAERLQQIVDTVMEHAPEEFAYTEEKTGGRPRKVLARR